MVEAIGTGVVVLVIYTFFMVWTHRALPGFMVLKAAFAAGGWAGILATMLDKADLVDGGGAKLVALVGLVVVFASGLVLLAACMNANSKKPQ